MASQHLLFLVSKGVKSGHPLRKQSPVVRTWPGDGRQVDENLFPSATICDKVRHLALPIRVTMVARFETVTSSSGFTGFHDFSLAERMGETLFSAPRPRI